MSAEKLKGLLTTGEWFQCQGTVDSLRGKEEIPESSLVPKGHAIFHVDGSNKKRINLIVFADRQSLRKEEEPTYPVSDLRILERVNKDLGDIQGHKYCPSCRHLLEIHQEQEGQENAKTS